MFLLCRIIFWLPAKLLYPTKIIGKKNLPKKKAIIACNHQSNLDAVLFYLNTGFKFYTLVKAELYKKRFSRWLFSKLYTIPVNRKENDLGAIKQCLKVLNQKDKPLLIFPSGTREEDAKTLDHFKNGTSMIAVKTQSDIIPIAFNRKPGIFRRTKIYVGEKIEISKFLNQDKDKNEIYNDITNEIKKSINNLINAK